MAGLLYYLPGEDAGRAPAVTIERVRERGLGYAFGDRVVASGLHHGGPEGGSGVVVADPGRVKKVGYYLDGQVWRTIPGTDLWVGFYRDQRPTPEDLARANQLPGHLVRLADGLEYLVPVARGWADGESDYGYYNALPKGPTTLDEAGDWVPGDADPNYAELWEIAQRYWDAKHEAIRAAFAETEEEESGAVRVEFNFSGLHDKALAILSVNYRLAKAEVALLGLFDHRAAIAILDALVDWPTYLAWREKKMALETSDG